MSRTIPGICPVCEASKKINNGFDNVFVPELGYVKLEKQCRTCRELEVRK